MKNYFIIRNVIGEMHLNAAKKQADGEFYIKQKQAEGNKVITLEISDD